MELVTTTSSASRRTSACLIVGVFSKGKLGEAAADIDAQTNGALSRLVKHGDVDGRLGTSRIISDLPGIKAKRILLVGLGKSSAFDVGAYRRAVSTAANAIKHSLIGDVACYLNLESVDGVNAYYLSRYTVESLLAAMYQYSTTKSGRALRVAPLKKICIATASRGDANKAKLGGQHALAIVEGQSLARDLGNLPPNICTPTYLARTAQKLDRQHKNVSTKVIGEAEIKRLGMGAFLSVTKGTILPAKLIVMRYKGAGKQAPVVLVGKGITFDAGGISLKPGPGMDEMKFDMCGAASVIGAMKVIARLKLEVNLTVVVPTCENLPSGTATRPGDIVTSMDGKTIEILNTDAEGRLILCDALTYSRRFKPEVVIDVATLTGACVIALGHHRTAVMTRSDELAGQLLDAGVAADDKAWQLPIDGEYDNQLKSNFADLANVGGRDGGAVTAASFLSKFTADLNWAHLDIAGTAWKSGGAKGSTGRPVPMLSEFILRFARAIP